MSGRGMPGLPDVVVENDVPCVVRDGTTLVADVYRPRGAENSPVLLLRLPYDKTAAESNFGFAHPSWYAAHGYMVVVQDCRGAGGSEGGWYPFVHEADDGYDAIEWAARLPGSNGRVGTYGFSYPGYLQLQTACLRPPSLVTISPGFAAAQAYEGWTYDQGALRIAFVAFWAMLLELASLKRQGDEDGMQAQLAALGQMPELNWVLPLTAIPSLVETDYWQDWLAHPSYDGYWRPLSIDEDYSRITVSALHVGGWYDVFINGTADNFAGLRAGAGSEDAAVAQKLVIGPWLHGPWKPLVGAGGDAGSNIVDDWQLRWFDHVLKGEDNGALDAPATVYVVGDGWHDLDGWPPSRARPTDWFLHSRGRANTATGDGWLSTEPPGDELPDTFIYDPGNPSLSFGGHSCCVEGISPEGPAPQGIYEQARGVLCYTSEPLERHLDVLGDVVLTLYAATSAVDTDWTCRLCVVDEDTCCPSSTNIQEGIVRARYRSSASDPTPVKPGEIVEYQIRLGPVGWRIKAGQRLRVDVSSSDFPQWDRNLNTGGIPGQEGPAAAVVATQVVLHNQAHPSRITLPVVD
ncbi:MAG: CocE/NonD family hydrolase [Actinomycetia bacterium]|nr:CocE/NonD family hydrolase [Actinomycetes bacterium]